MNQSAILHIRDEFKKGSTWLLVALIPLFIAIAELPTLKNAIDAIPLLSGYGAPIAALAAVLATKLRSSGRLSTQAQAYAAEIVRLTLNKQLAPHGLEIPAPPGGPPPLPTSMQVPNIPQPQTGVSLVVTAAPPPPPAPAPDPLVQSIAAIAPPGTSMASIVVAAAALRNSRSSVDVDLTRTIQ